MVETIPSYEEMMPVVLKVLADGQLKSLRQITEEASAAYGFTNEQLALTLPSGKQTYVYSRVGWAKEYLVKAGLLEQPSRGICSITERGRATLRSNQKVNNQYLSQFDEFVQYKQMSNQATSQSSKAKSSETVDDSSLTPSEQISKAFSALNSALADELLGQIHSVSPKFFEQLVVDLMLAMGYGGSQKDAGQATQYTNDGGIDGIIKEDKLGLDSIYLQAKRYRDNTVGRPDIQAFAGALDMHRARKGVFITTSSFSKDAREFVSMIEKRIVLIDGRELAALMIEHNVGVSTRELYAVKAIDSDYFLVD
ncbi:restriction endonuclease [Shewanella alkalitolerans]|uniref:restriction endonuclease n=1 Tax=Shewanella alkalitolerans TaxID=2864209 RepID=UPI001C65E360|nr:restriction endonuclease [Shewanella alkalitolerans]QYJ99358.1 restriction endonuclease [Shewanella alkalitolerans]